MDELICISEGNFRNVFNVEEIQKIQDIIVSNKEFLTTVVMGSVNKLSPSKIKTKTFKITTAYKNRLTYKHREYKLTMNVEVNNRNILITDYFIVCSRCGMVDLSKNCVDRLEDINQCCKISDKAGGISMTE